MACIVVREKYIILSCSTLTKAYEFEVCPKRVFVRNLCRSGRGSSDLNWSIKIAF